jgi:hypothetical protein
MEKQTKTAEELIALLNDALQKTAVCKDVRVKSVHRDDNPHSQSNWTAEYLTSSGEHASPDCKRAFIAEKYRLQQMYDLKAD